MQGHLERQVRSTQVSLVPSYHGGFMREKEAKTVLSPQNGMNIYRGCTFGCLYCDPRAKCYRNTGEFEDVEVKVNAAALLEKSLRSKRRHCMIGVGSMSDPYQSAEAELKLMRTSLELINYYGYGVAIETRSDLILRDLDYLMNINEKAKCVVVMPLCSVEDGLCSQLEPNAPVTSRRVEVLRTLHQSGIQTVVSFSPILPFFNDTEENLTGLLTLAKEVRVYGILCDKIGIQLKNGSREWFYEHLERSFPEVAERYKEVFGTEQELISPENDRLMKLIRDECKKNGIVSDASRINTYLKGFEDKLAGEQLSLLLA